MASDHGSSLRATQRSPWSISRPARPIEIMPTKMMSVRSTPNVINFVGAEERRATGKARGHIKPRPLSRQEVDRIFKRAAEKKPVVKVDLTEGDQILVTAGPFKDFQGEVIEVSGERNKLKALLSIFGRETPVELEFSQISKQS